jgi:hypothetical protein
MHHAIHQVILTQLNRAVIYPARNAKDAVLGNHHLELVDGGKEGRNQPSLEKTDLSPRRKLRQYVRMLAE